MSKTKKETQDVKEEIRFSKQVILKSKKYENRIDLLGALLKDKKKYTFTEVDSILSEFLKGKVD